MKPDLKTINKINNSSIKKLKKNYEFLGEGIARKVFAIDENFVVKVAKNEDGYHQNFVERYIYKTAPDFIKNYLCPIHYANERITVMSRALPYNKVINKIKFSNPSDFVYQENVLKDLNYLIKHYLLFEEDLFVTSSWGMVDKNIYLIDYGCTSDYGDFIYDNLRNIYNLSSFICY